MNKNVLMVTFNTEPWNLSVTLEIIFNEIKRGNKVTWFLLDNFSLDKELLPITNKLRSREIRQLLDNLFLSEPQLFANINLITSIDITSKARSKSERSREVARAELISRLRDSDPCLSHNVGTINQYSQIYMRLNNFFNNFLSKNVFEKAFVFNGRPLCERAFNDAARFKGLRINYFETYNENWKDRYFIFMRPTHSVKYRSKVMENFSKSEKIKDAKNYNKLSKIWFEQRIAGVTQSYTKHQTLSDKFLSKKPYFVFFHSSQDELEMVGLTDKYWGSQINILKILVRIFKSQTKYDLVLRIHPHLIRKSKKDQYVWSKIGENLQSKYPWFTYLGPTNPVNSYDLVKGAHGVITSGSTIGVEAAYLKKPSILIGDAFHKFMGITINPKSISDLENRIKLSRQINGSDKSFKSSLKYGYFHSQGGAKFNFVKYHGKNCYTLNSFRLSYSWYVRAIRALELKINSTNSKRKFRRCDCDYWVNSSAGW